MIEFHLPTLPPSKNALRVRTRRGIARSKTYEAWLAEFGWEMKIQRIRKVEGPYKLTLQAVRPDKRRRDLANLLESVSDALHTHKITDDDSQAEMVVMRWVTVGAGVSIRVEPAGVE